MIQDITPMVFHNEYREFQPDEDSIIMIFSGDKLLVKQRDGLTVFPLYEETLRWAGAFYYLFMIDEEKYFLLIPGEDTNVFAGTADFQYVPYNNFREMSPKYSAFAAVTAGHLYRFYMDNRYCGRCGGSMQTDELERMLRCPECGNLIYPRISPAVIVGVVDGDRILMTKYAGREYRRYALVAGFAEIGETLEQTVAREVMEEVGLQVRNIRYYKSQPWALSGTLLSGYYADLDGSDEIILDENELSEAVWFKRNEIPVEDDGISLTKEMIRVFMENKY